MMSDIKITNTGNAFLGGRGDEEVREGLRQVLLSSHWNEEKQL